ncbi:MAG: SDR family oxidoreductase [Verrucomicrobia bacterium]|nr:SDR family oxidoreductase [Verrucomicrobiota bacterium]
MIEPTPQAGATAIQLPDLRGGSALVTGSSRGIGRAVVEALVAHDVRCFGLADQGFSAERHPQVVSIRCDLSDAQAIEHALAVVAAQTESLDYLVNVAGTDAKYGLEEGTVDVWDSIVDLNLRAYYLLIRGRLPLLRRGRGGSIVNVSSINYRLGVVGRSIYSTTKAGILGLTAGLTRELGREGIRINTVTPGWVFTERQVEEYFAAPDAEKHLRTLHEKQALTLHIEAADVANHILFYLSNVSRASTGHNCVVDGGWLLE